MTKHSFISSSDPRQTRAVIGKCILLLLAIGLSLALLDRVLAREESEALERQLQAIKQRRSDITCLIFGDSHVAYGLINAELPSHVGVIARPAQNWHERLIIWEHLAPQLPNLKRCIVPAAPHHMAPLPGIDDFSHLVQYASARRLTEIYKCPWLTAFKARAAIFDNRERRKWVQLTLRPRRSLRHLVESGSIVDASGDYSYPGDERWDRVSTSEQISATKTRVEHMLPYQVGPGLLASAQQFRDHCRARGIAVIGLHMPVPSQLRREIETWARSDEQLKQLKEFEGTFDAVIDCRTMFDDNLKSFQDTDHLNSHGAAIFTRVMAERLQPFSDPDIHVNPAQLTSSSDETATDTQ